MTSSPGRDDVLREFVKHRSNLFAFVLSIVRDFAFAEEVLQEVAVVVCDQWEDFQPGTNFSAWASRIVRNKIFNLNRVSRRELLLSPEAIAGIERAAEAEPETSSLDAVRKCLEGVTDRIRSVLSMRYREGLSGAEIARRTKSTVTAVHMALSRARSVLARCVEARVAREEGAP
jgi:RNA polymerase sigma-70 factor (ECF subfamily)